MSTQAVAFPVQSVPASRIMVLDSNVVLLEYIRETLGDLHSLQLFSEKASLSRELAGNQKPGMILLAWDDAGRSLPILQHIMAKAPNVPVILLACTPDHRDMKLVMNMGVREVILKPFDQADLATVIEKHLSATENPDAPLKLAQREDVEIPIGEDRYFVRSSAAMRSIERRAKQIAASDIPVLILGESGTGKEVLALLVHKNSHRSKQMFLKVNCAAMPADLLESELFGYEQGAFTGAAKAKPGKFEVCNGGTIFLDEIGEMPASLQAKLLHVLQDGSFSRLGGKSTIKVDVRVVAATNINIRQSIADKSFREDLYYRLDGFSLTLPPLRERADEVRLLADYFMRRAAAKYQRAPLPFSAGMMQVMSQYSWPGNLRELENVVSRYLILEDEDAILREMRPVNLPVPITPPPPMQQPTPAAVEIPVGEGLKSLVRSLKGDAEAMAILGALEETRWNRKAAARNLQISYKALLYKIKNYNLGSTK